MILKILCHLALLLRLVDASSRDVTRSQKHARIKKIDSLTEKLQVPEHDSEAEDEIVELKDNYVGGTSQTAAMAKKDEDVESGVEEKARFVGTSNGDSLVESSASNGTADTMELLEFFLPFQCFSSCKPAYFEPDDLTTNPEMLEKGVVSFRWVNPREPVLFEGALGELMSPDHQGGFMYQMNTGFVEYCTVHPTYKSSPFIGGRFDNCRRNPESKLGKFEVRLTCEKCTLEECSETYFHAQNTVLIPELVKHGLEAYRHVNPIDVLTLSMGLVLVPGESGGFLYRTVKGGAVYCLFPKYRHESDDGAHFRRVPS